MTFGWNHFEFNKCQPTEGYFRVTLDDAWAIFRALWFYVGTILKAFGYQHGGPRWGNIVVSFDQSSILGCLVGVFMSFWRVFKAFCLHFLVFLTGIIALATKPVCSFDFRYKINEPPQKPASTKKKLGAKDENGPTKKSVAKVTKVLLGTSKPFASGRNTQGENFSLLHNPSALLPKQK